MARNTIGDRLRQLREEKGETQDDVAMALHEVRQTVSAWEKNERDLKTQKTIALARHYGVTCDYILQGVEPENFTVSSELGLTDKVISILSKRFFSNLKIINTINTLIEEAYDNNFVHTNRSILDLITLFLNCKAIWHTLNTMNGEMKKCDENRSEINMHSATFDMFTVAPEVIEAAILTQISQALRDLKTKGGCS